MAFSKRSKKLQKIQKIDQKLSNLRGNGMPNVIHHGQIAQVSETGDINIFYPKTFSKNIYVNSNRKTLETFLGTTDISGIGDGTVSGALYDMYQSANTKAPTSHAVNANTYGLGTNSVYGHVKISDNVTTSAGSASQSICASGKSVNDFYNGINNTLGGKVDVARLGPTSGDWRSGSWGIHAYHYEGTGTSYGLPRVHMDVLVIDFGNRKIAFAVQWAKTSDNIVFVNTYHDKWEGWKR